MTRISVCIATFNGSRYIESQLNSILCQVGFDDEIVITDDNSSDNTCEIIEGYADPRIKLFRNNVRLGHVQNFAKAVSLASGEFIALSDQDDVWVESRLDKMLQILKDLPPYSLVIGDFCEINEAGTRKEPFAKIGKSPSIMWVQLIKIFLGKAKYFGCTFVFRSDLKILSFPIPSKIEAHDIWIAMNACIHGRIAHCEDLTLLRRIHGDNLTPVRRRNLFKIIRSRLIYSSLLFLSLLK